MKLIVEIPDHFARLITMDNWEKRALLNILISERICETATEALTHIKGMGIEAGTPQWEAWVETTRALAAQEARTRAETFKEGAKASKEERARRAKNGGSDAATR
ncbi:MAG: hypothetical protein C5B44_01425 [Acidobacteria bacterium]|nr:MAG: hypothetical protein C5B44_01425 [Acidobacteriota bacterium]